MDNSTLTHILNATEDFKYILRDERIKAIRSGSNPTLKVGDTVLWSHGWCSMPIKTTTVTRIESRDGKSHQSVPWSSVVDEVVVDLAGGQSWAYGYQIAPINEAQKEVA
jgi:hypothetical protein